MKLGKYSFYNALLLLSTVSLTLAKSVVVTGGAGFIGGHVVQALLDRGDRVMIVDNFATNGYDSSADYNQMKRGRINYIMKQYPDTLSLHEIDINDAQALDALFGEFTCDVICHLAARAGVRPSIEQPASYMQTNVVGTINLLECARKYKIPHCVLASSSSVYGSQESGPFVETKSTDHQSSPYGASKKALELVAHVYHHLYGISCSCLRFFTVYGPYGRFDMAPFIFMNAIYHGEPIKVVGDGSAVRDFTYVDDIVAGIIKAIDLPCGFETFNLGCGNPVVLSDFIRVIEEVVGKKANIIYEPMCAGDVPFTHADIQKANTYLGYEPKTLIKEGIEKAFEWFNKRE